MLSIIYIIAVTLIVYPVCIFFFNLDKKPGEKRDRVNWRLVLIGFFLLLTVYVSMKEGRDDAIKQAELITWDDQGYIISFNSEVHFYDWTGPVFYEGERNH